MESEKLREEKMLGMSGAEFTLSELTISRFKFLPQLTTILGRRETCKEDSQMTGKGEEHGGDVDSFLLSKLFSLNFLFFWDSEPSPKAIFLITPGGTSQLFLSVYLLPACIIYELAFTFVCWGLFGLGFGSNGVYRPDHICCACKCGFLSSLPCVC